MPTGVYERKPGLYPGRHMRPPLDRLMARVTKSADGCWLRSGSGTRNGYSTIGRGRSGEGTTTAHRLMWEITNGPVPPGIMVCHTCDVRRCVNPAHLFLGTAKDNTQDMLAKGRFVNSQARRTHCPRSHAYDEANTYRDKRGRRQCKECKRAWNRRKSAK